MQNELNEIIKEIESTTKSPYELVKASDSVNLKYHAIVDGVIVMSVYKSFDKNFNPINIYRWRDIR